MTELSQTAILALKELMDKSVKDGIAPLHKDITEVKGTLSDHDKRLEKLEAASSAGAAGSGTSRAETVEARSAGPFVPRFFSIENFCTYDDRRSKGVSRLEAEELMEKLKKKVPESLREKIGEIECFGSRCNKIKVHIQPPFAVEIALIFKEALEDESLFYNGRRLWTSVQKQPSEQAKFQKVGKARAFLDAKTKAVQAESYAKCSYEPCWVLSATMPTRRL